MNRYHLISRYLRSFSGILIFLLIISIILPVSGNATSTKNNQNYVISGITLSSEESRISPGMNITPNILIQNNGDWTEQNVSIKFSAVLGSASLIGDNTAWPAPDAGEKKDYSVRFAIPFIQPGEYPLEITVTQDSITQSDKRKSHVMKYKSPIQVGHPKTGSGVSDCGCS